MNAARLGLRQRVCLYNYFIPAILHELHLPPPTVAHDHGIDAPVFLFSIFGAEETTFESRCCL